MHARTTPLRWITDALLRSVSLVVLLAAAARLARLVLLIGSRWRVVPAARSRSVLSTGRAFP
ncbi:MAG TPA: hypothetical protein VGA45_12085, partial [Actinomycetota bacterium]